MQPRKRGQPHRGWKSAARKKYSPEVERIMMSQYHLMKQRQSMADNEQGPNIGPGEGQVYDKATRMIVVLKGSTPLQKLEGICAEIYSQWDKDMRSGKLLSALAGGTPGYRQDVTDVRAALEQSERLHGENEKMRNRLCEFEEMLRTHITLFSDIEQFGAEAVCLNGYAAGIRKLLESTS